MNTSSEGRYLIGIDLGTTNSTVAYVDTDISTNPTYAVHSFRVPQITATGQITTLPALPSFCYLASKEETNLGMTVLPWVKEKEIARDYLVGAYAQESGAKIPTRLVRSAKSWLCNGSTDRKEKILPFESDDSKKISPVEATSRYLAHIRDSWNYVMAKGNSSAEFDLQEVVITVPASFDEAARSLTVQAAKAAGYEKMTLLEEPQAAFYSWILQNEKRWKETLKADDLILVCDVGGGTTDFSLIEVQQSNETLSFQRMSVGKHLLLGGDNMDAALCHYLEEKLRNEGKITGELDILRWHRLHHEARRGKEILLSGSQQSYQATIQGSGSNIVSNTISTHLDLNEVSELLLKGFFGNYTYEEAIDLNKGSGIRTVGLAYESDPSITKQLAHFLHQAQSRAPDYILFNGGTMKPALFQESIISSLERWFAKKPQVLSSYSFDLAVSRGAAYFGRVRRGLGVRIGGGIARTLYLGIDVKNTAGNPERQALTLLPRGSEEGSTFTLQQTFILTPNRPIAFPLYSSHVRMGDNQGDLVGISSEEMTILPPIHTILRYGKSSGSQDPIEVALKCSLTHIGTLDLWLESVKTPHQWQLEFQLRSSSGEENSVSALDGARTDVQYDRSFLIPAQEAIQQLYSSNRIVQPKEIMDHLEKLLGSSRQDWSPHILRHLFQILIEKAPQRKSHAELETRWWNLIGFCLRPGFGYPLDDFRIKELWKVILSERGVNKSLNGLIQQWICYRRIAGGLNKGQQQQIASELLPSIFDKRGKIESPSKSDEYAYSEKIRALASLERVDGELKARIGHALVERICSGKGLACDYWSLARIGARHLLYGSIGDVVSRSICTQWIEKLIKLDRTNEQLTFVIAQLARKSDQRELNISQDLLEKVILFLGGHEDLQKLLLEECSLTTVENDRLYGDHLPAGLSLNSVG